MPPWLAARMVTLGTAIAESVLHHYGRPALLSRLSDPFWFQALGIGDGHGLALVGHHHLGDGRPEEGPEPASRTSSASTSAAAAAGSRATRRDELRDIADATGLDGDALVRTSRLTARIDNNAVADGFQIYLHSFVVTADGEWAVVQQGMNDASRPGPPVSLALGGGARLHRRSAHRHRRRARPVRSGTWSTAAREPAQDALLTDRPRRSRRDAGRRPPARDARRTTTCAPATSTRGGWARCWRWRTSATCAISPRSCCSNSSDRARCSRWRSSPRSCTARRRASTTRRASRSRTAARTATRSRCRCRSTTSRSRCCGARSTPRSSAHRQARRNAPARRVHARDRAAPAPRPTSTPPSPRTRDLAVARRPHRVRRPPPAAARATAPRGQLPLFPPPDPRG